jgi:hypothetical protein
MTVDGITRSPRGQPALYEYRFSDTAAPDHGWVDKPTMMWSAGFCIGTAYRMIGLDDNAWNLSVGGGLPAALRAVEADYMCGTATRIRASGRGPTISRILLDGEPVPSRVLPAGALEVRSIQIEHGPVRHPYLDGVNAILHAANLDTVGRNLTLTLSSFEGHATAVSVVSPWVPESASLNGAEIAVTRGAAGSGQAQRLTLDYRASKAVDTLILHFGTP